MSASSYHSSTLLFCPRDTPQATSQPLFEICSSPTANIIMPRRLPYISTSFNLWIYACWLACLLHTLNNVAKQNPEENVFVYKTIFYHQPYINASWRQLSWLQLDMERYPEVLVLVIINLQANKEMSLSNFNHSSLLVLLAIFSLIMSQILLLPDNWLS